VAGVPGWVRNRRDGAVAAWYLGAREACARLAAACCRGPRAAQVARVEVARAAYDESVTVFDLRPSA
jgi:acylphosphatase